MKNIKFAHPSIADNLFIGAQATATWSDSRYSDAFYGVTPQQAQRRNAIAATSPLITPYGVFDAGSGLTDVTLGVGLFKTFGPSDQFFANLDVGYSFALGDLKNSPITEETSTPGGALTLGWEF